MGSSGYYLPFPSLDQLHVGLMQTKTCTPPRPWVLTRAPQVGHFALKSSDMLFSFCLRMPGPLLGHLLDSTVRACWASATATADSRS